VKALSNVVPNEIAAFFAKASVQDHQQRSQDPAATPEDAVTSLLISQMRPSAYVVVAREEEAESGAAALAALDPTGGGA